MTEHAPSTMKVAELAERCGIDESTAFRYLRAGKLPGVQVGARWVIDRDRVDRFLAGREDAGGTPPVPAGGPATRAALPRPVLLGPAELARLLRLLRSALDVAILAVEPAPPLPAQAGARADRASA